MMLMNIQDILADDRVVLEWFNGSDSVFMDNWMTILTSGFTWMPLYVAMLYLVIKNNDTMAQILLVVACSAACVLLSDGVADLLVKPSVGRWRPCNDPIYKYTIKVVTGVHSSDYGFFSAHASNTFSIALFFCLLVRDRVLSVMLVLWSLVNCYTRMYLGLHYPLDILCGLAWGGIVGVGVYFVYTKIRQRMSAAAGFVSTQYTSTGYSFQDVDIVVATLVATFVYSVIRAVLIYD